MNIIYDNEEYPGSNDVYISYTEVNTFKTNNMNIKPPKKKRKWPIVLLILLLIVVGVLGYLTFFTDKLDFIKQDDEKYSEFDPNKGKIESNSNIDSNNSSNEISNKNIEIKSIAIAPSNSTLVVGSKISLKVNINPSDATNKKIIWKSSDTKIATVNSNGVVTGIKAGTVVISATSVNGKKSSIKVTVTDKKVPVTGISLSSTSVQVYKGKIYNIKANVLPTNATNKSIIWVSQDPKIATVTNDGLVTGISVGKTTIKATTKEGNYSKSVLITVLESDVQSIKFDTDVYYIRLGSKYKPNIIFNPSNAINGKNIVWSIRDKEFATIDGGGTITPIKEGMTYVTATTSNGKTAKLKIFLRLTPTDYNIKISKDSNNKCVMSLINIRNNVEVMDFEYIKYNSKLYYPSSTKNIPCNLVDQSIATARWKSSGQVGYDSSVIYIGF